ncbi:MAG: glycine cleavage system aminomethyltransferase GcvT [Thermoplasmata archaeon]|nr:glycine cleavage system aminomethyltransferase GcvT [Thermoplasmata archaeon]
MTEAAGVLETPGAAPVRLRQTPLDAFHRRHHGQMVPFAGWEMPLHYGSIVDEHRAVRTSVGFFDVSHMGILSVRGGTAPALLSRRTTANVSNIAPGQCRYTFLLDAFGEIIDDLILTRVDEGGGEAPPAFVVVPNAARAAKIRNLLQEHRKPDTVVGWHNDAVAILAVQGPESRASLERLFGWSLGGLSPFHAGYFGWPSGSAGGTVGRLLDDPFPGPLVGHALVSRTGYTGELGYELFVKGAVADEIAERLVAGGARPCGLGARDTLRLEKGFLLSGQDFHEDRTPLEAGQDRFVEFDHKFVGREALEKQQEVGVPAHLVGLALTDPAAIPRHGQRVLAGDQPAGIVTSGGFSPTLQHGIALAFVAPPLSMTGTVLAVDIRGRPAPARVVPLPFVPSGRTS